MKKYLLRFKWVIVVIIIIALIVMGKSFLDNQADADTETVSKAQMVQVEKIIKEEKNQTLELTGTIEAKDSIVVTSKFGGKIKEILIQNGIKANNGQILLLMDDTQQQNALIAAQNTLAKARANLNYVQKNFERMTTLYQAEAISRNDYDNSKLSYDVALADVNLAQASLSNAQEALQDTRVSNKLDGFVADCDIKEGQVVEVGTPLMTVQNLSSAYLVVNINQEDITKIKIGQKVNVSVDSLSETDFEGVVEIMNPVANSSSRSFEVKILVPNADFLLKPGMFAQAQIIFDSTKMAIMVPQAAVSGKDGVYYVYVVKGKMAERRLVELGDTVGQEIEVKFGIKEKEQLIISNVNKLKDGDAIQIAEEE